MAFNDHFSRGSSNYATFRPTYPAELIAAVAARAPGLALAWDCGTGNGQAALQLAEHFDRVVATDASAAQIQAATPHARVAYRVAPAGASALPERSVDAICVAQALHWFDLPAFFREVRRVAVDGGLLAVWSYGLLRIDPPIDALIEELYSDVVGSFWPPQRALVESAYRGVDFPFDEIAMPPFVMHERYSLAHLGGYLGTWSAVRRYAEARGEDPVAPILARIATLWGGAERIRDVHWPVTVRAGHVTGEADA